MANEITPTLSSFFTALDDDTRDAVLTTAAADPNEGLRTLMSHAEAAGLSVSSDEAIAFLSELDSDELDMNALASVVGGAKLSGDSLVYAKRGAKLIGDSNVYANKLTGDSPVYAKKPGDE